MDWKQLARFQDGLSAMGIAGNDLAVFLNGKTVYRHCTGWQDIGQGIPITEQTLYRMFSMTKLITCAAALQLWEQGGFLMNDPVADYLP